MRVVVTAVYECPPLAIPPLLFAWIMLESLVEWNTCIEPLVLLMFIVVRLCSVSKPDVCSVPAVNLLCSCYFTVVGFGVRRCKEIFAAPF